MAKETQLHAAQKKAQAAIDETNRKIEELGQHSSVLNDALTNIQIAFDKIRNVPTEEQNRYERIKEIRLGWKRQAETIEKEFKEASIKNAGAGAAGASVGVAVAALGPTAAMGIATTFGVASTGTAIASLSGAAATNAALAWLGGGALAAGGGGMAAGEIFLSMFGPVGWTIAGAALLVSAVFAYVGKGHKDRLEQLFLAISDRDVRHYQLAIVELCERITRISDETEMLRKAADRIASFGLDYSKMTEAQQYELGAYVNLMNASTELLTHPILGLAPKVTEQEFDAFWKQRPRRSKMKFYREHKDFMIGLANFLYGIDMDEKDKRLLLKVLRKDKEKLENAGIASGDFDFEVMNIVQEALTYQRTLHLEN